MRNLKKILALVLALVMSLSLMSVAGATEFPDSDQISETYAESVDVLTGLKVFQGNKGEFKPKDNITRAEVANIIYRIVTGDVDGTSVGIYADYNKFTDVPNTAWFAGCVNYCANAEYIKGRGNGKFDPYGNVTGYEALAMILRAIGYDKNGEFTGANWQVQTAATARNRGITKNIVEGTLGVAASREMVAEILCQTILVPVADYSLAFGYRTTDAVTGKENETLAKKTFGMERLEGVVTANEYASLTATSPLAAGQTTIGDKTLNVTSTLDDLGESRYVYVIPQAGTTRYDLVSSKVYDTGDNNVYDSGDEVKTVGNSTGSENGITSITGAQHFINYDEVTEYTTNMRLSYRLHVRMSEYDAMTMLKVNGGRLYDSDANKVQGAQVTTANNPEPWETTIPVNGGYYIYEKDINAFTKLDNGGYDYNNIRNIFIRADLNGPNITDIVDGEVYEGTTSVGNNNGRPADLSDTINWDTFVNKYLVGDNNKKQVSSNGLGCRLKIVDNNNDGVAEYVLQTIYTVAIVSSVSDSSIGLDVANAKMTDGDQINEITASTKGINDGEGDLAVGDVVIYAKIDGNARMQKAAGETAKINTVNRAAKTATSVDGTEWKESWVHGTHTATLGSYVSGLVGNTTYNLYFDLYGNLAAYTEGDNGQFVLITDGWYNNTVSGPEYAVRAYIDGSLQTQNVTTGGNLFIGNARTDNSWGNLKNFNGLNSAGGTHVQTVVANLDNGILTPVDKMYNYLQTVRMIDMVNNAIPGSNTVTVDGNLRYTDYSANEAYTASGFSATSNPNPVKVTALSTTTYYYVYKSTTDNGKTFNTVVRTHTGYTNLPVINSEQIEDVYVVGTRATNAVNENYYTANVVVVELNARYTGANLVDAEIVFVPDFHELTDSLGFENVTMILEDGTVGQRSVNMGKSNLDWYDTTGNLVRGARQPGLFYLSEDETTVGKWVLNRMTAAQIRGSRILGGYTNRSTATMVNDWASIDVMGVDGVAGNAPQAINEVTAAESRARIAEASKFYTLAYDSAKVATLTESNASTVLAQNKNLDVNWDNNATASDAYLNEFVQGDGANRNEVLVVYKANGDIAFAVSFNEYRNQGNALTGVVARDFAQEVWYSCLPSVNESKGVSFYGDGTVGANNTITVDYATAKAHTGATISVTGTNVRDWTLMEVDTATGRTTVIPDAKGKTIEPDKDNTKTYRLDVYYYNNTTPTQYTLIQNPATATARLIDIKTGLTVNPGAAYTATNFRIPAVGAPGQVNGPVTTVDGNVIFDGTPIANLTLAGFTSLFRLEGTGATVEWLWRTADGKEITEPTENETMQNVVGIRAIVKNQKGVQVAEYVAGNLGGTTYTVTVATGDSINVTAPNGGLVKTDTVSSNTVYTVLENTQLVFAVAGADKQFTATAAGGAIEYISATNNAAGTDSVSVAYPVTKNVTITAPAKPTVTVTNATNVTTTPNTAVTVDYNGSTTYDLTVTASYLPGINMTSAAANGKAELKQEAGVWKLVVSEVKNNVTITLTETDLTGFTGATIGVDANGDPMVTLTGPVTVAAPVEIKNGQKLTVDTAGQTLTATGTSAFTVKDGGELVIEGNGTVSGGANTAVVVDGAGSLKVTDATLVTTGSNKSALGLTEDAAGSTVELTNVKVNGSATSYGLSVNGRIASGSTITMDNVTVNSGIGAYFAGPVDTITITNSTINGTATDGNGVEVRAGTVTISNSTITSKASTWNGTSFNDNGPCANGAAVELAQHTTKQPIRVTITDSTLSADNNVSLAVSNTSPSDGDVGYTINVSGCTIPDATNGVRNNTKSTTITVNGVVYPYPTV